MQQKKHYIGLTDAEVLESRKKYGVNILLHQRKNRYGNNFWRSSQTHLSSS